MTSLPTCCKVSFYDNARGAFELCGRVRCPMAGGTPTALAAVAVETDSDAARERLLCGDSLGGILMLGPGVGQHLLPAQELAPGRDYEVVNTGHTGWVTQVRHRFLNPCYRGPLISKLVPHGAAFFVKAASTPARETHLLATVEIELRK